MNGTDRDAADVRTPPHSLEAEQAVLGGLLLDAAAWFNVSDVVHAEDFYRPDHRTIFDAIRALATSQKPTDAVTVAEHLERHGLAASVGGLAYLGTLARDTPTAANVRAYAEIVHERALLRQLIQAGKATISSVDKQDGRTARELLEESDARNDVIRTALAADTSWSKPVNLFEELAAPPFEAPDLPECLSAFACAFSARSGIDPTITLTAATAAAAMAIDDAIMLEADRSTRWRQPARLWILDIGSPGAGKTPGQREMLKVLWEINASIRKQWEADSAAATDEEPAPRLQRVLIGDTTVEALSGALDGNPRGVGIVIDEFESWLGGIDAYLKKGSASRDRGAWLQLFDGGPHSIERVQRGSIFVENFGASILTATTPAALAKLAKSLPDDGLLQRFIPAIARRQNLDAQPGIGVDTARDKYVETVKRLFALKVRTPHRCVTLGSEAAAAFQTWRRENQLLGEAMGSLTPALESHIAKHPALLLRVALTFHCATIVNFDDPDARDPMAWPVSIATIQTATRFMSKAAKHAMAMFVSLAGAGKSLDLARDIARALLVATGPTMARRDLQAKVRGFRNAEPHEQNAALSLLVDMAWIRPAEGGYAKGHVTRLEINPLIKSQFKHLSERERERRAMLRESIAGSISARRTEP